MPALRYFPSEVFLPEQWQWEVMGQVVSGGQTATGQMPVTRFDGGGLWKASLSDISLWTSDQRRAWRALTSITDGGTQPVIVPMHDMPDAPFPGGVTSYDPIFHSGDVPFEGGVGYHADVVDVEAYAAAALQATSMRILVNYGADLQGGEFFSIDDATMRWRLYRVATVEPLSPSNHVVITFRPSLRAPVAVGTRLVFDNPRCVMRLASSAAMDATFRAPWFGKPSVSFVECLPPFPPST